MGINFPAAPIIGELYPTPAIAGIPQYKWDGTAWLAMTPSALTYVQRGGDTMTGHLALPTSPAAANAVRRDFVEAYAAPFDAMSYSGMQINGGMEVNQTPGAVGAGGYVGDGWRVGTAGSMSVSALIDGTGGTLFYTPYRLLLSVTAGASLTTNDYTQVQQYIEGYRVVRLQWGKTSAQPITIGFWTAHHRTGLYSVVVRNGADNRSYATTYTQNAADIAQYNVVTIPGDTTGTWTVDNTIGLKVAFSFGCGTAFTATSANTWLAGNYIAAPGQINAAAAATDVFRLTGVVVLPGSQAPTAAQSPLIMRPYDQELLTCERYYQKYTGMLVEGYQAAGGVVYKDHFLTTPMRAVPTLGATNHSFGNSSNLTINQLAYNHIRLALTITVQAYGFVTADVTLDARL